MLRHLFLICTLVLSWQQETLSSAINPKSPSSNHTDLNTSNNNSNNSSQLDSANNTKPVEDVPLKLRKWKVNFDSDVPHLLPLISFGRPTTYGEWPWHVIVLYVFGDTIYDFCGGTLVTPNKVLTASHCVLNSTDLDKVFPDNYLVLAGSYHTNFTIINDVNAQILKVKRIVPHSGFEGDYFSNDIAVLTLDDSFLITDYVSPAPGLWDSAKNTDDLQNRLGTIVGNGVDEKNQIPKYPKMAHVEFVSNYYCILSNPLTLWRLFFSRTFCAMGFKNSTICPGDSGSGLFYRSGDKWLLRGIATGGIVEESGHCAYTDYGVFTDVAQYRDFIDENLI